MIRHYCTYFDHRYLPRGLVLARSLARWTSDAVLWVLCLDDLAFEAMSSLKEPGCRPIALSDIELGDDALLGAKQNRSTVEYYFTLTPSLVCYVLNRVGPDEMVTYLDSDLWFHSSPEPIYAEMGQSSVAITPHRFPKALKHLERHGLYNVGSVSFRNDQCGNACARWWRERCLEWCYDRVEEGRFADQAYLDQFAQIFGCVHAMEHPGVNLAPWNVAGHGVKFDGSRIIIDGKYPLVFFHFHDLRRIGRRRFLSSHFRYGRSLGFPMRRYLYIPYLRELMRAETDAAGYLGERPGLSLRLVVPPLGRKASLKRRWDNLLYRLRGDIVRVP